MAPLLSIAFVARSPVRTVQRHCSRPRLWPRAPLATRRPPPEDASLKIVVVALSRVARSPSVGCRCAGQFGLALSLDRVRLQCLSHSPRTQNRPPSTMAFETRARQNGRGCKHVKVPDPGLTLVRKRSPMPMIHPRTANDQEAHLLAFLVAALSRVARPPSVGRLRAG
jgi:hypothetical protein